MNYYTLQAMMKSTKTIKIEGVRNDNHDAMTNDS